MGLSLSRWLRGEPRPSLSSAFRPVAVPMSSRLEVLLSASAVPPGDSRSRWSSVHRSPHFLLSAGGDEATRLPAELSSDGVRAEKGAKDGLHVWEVTWTAELRGSHAVLGVSGHRCPLRGSGYAVLLGSDSQSWGWELRTNRLWHDGQSRGAYPEKRRRACGANEAQAARLAGSSPDEPDGPPLRVPERILLVLDADAGTLGFVVDGHFLGAAFDGLPRGAELFPAVSSVRGGARIGLRYLNGAARDPPALKALCGLLIRHHFALQKRHQVGQLPLPPALKRYLLSGH